MPVGALSRHLHTIGDFSNQAKRDGSLFQGGSGREEGSWSNPPRGEAPLFGGCEATLMLQEFALVCQFFTKLLLMLTDLAEGGSGREEGSQSDPPPPGIQPGIVVNRRVTSDEWHVI